MSDEGNRERRPGLRLNDAGAGADVVVDIKGRRRMSRSEDNEYRYEPSMLHRVIVGAPAASDEPQCEHETAERARDSQETDREQQLEETEEPRAFGDLRRRGGLGLVEPPPGRVAAGWDALREASSGSGAVARVGAGAAVLVPLALIVFVVAGQLSGSSARNFADTARPIAGAPSTVRAPVSLSQRSPSGRILRKQRPSARVRRHRAGRRPSASTALRARSSKRHASGSPSATASSLSPSTSPASSYTRPPSYTASYRTAPSVSGNGGASSGHTAGIASGGGTSGGGGSSSPPSGSGTRNFGQGGLLGPAHSPNG